MPAIPRDPAPHLFRQHSLERAVAAPEMVVKRGRGMKRNQAQEKEPNRFVHLQELLREWAVLANQRRKLDEEEQVHPVAVGVGLKEPNIGWISRRA